MRQHRRSAMMIGRLHFSLVVLVVAVLSGCATLPPGSNFPKIASSALAHPEETRLGRQFDNASLSHLATHCDEHALHLVQLRYLGLFNSTDKGDNNFCRFRWRGLQQKVRSFQLHYLRTWTKLRYKL